MKNVQLRTVVTTLSTVWQRTLLDSIFAPRRFRKVMPEFRKVSDMLFHSGVGSLEVGHLPCPAEPIQMLSIAPGYGGMPAQDLYALSRVVRWVSPKTIFEIGTFQGTTTAHMAVNSRAEIYTLDLPQDIATDLAGYTGNDAALLQTRDEIGICYQPFNESGRIHQLFGDSRNFDYGPYLGKMDLVLVDACHLFDYVISDSRKAFELLSPRGAVLWHDFGNSRDVVRALQVIAKEHPVTHLEGTALAIHTRGFSLTEASNSSSSKQVA